MAVKEKVKEQEAQVVEDAVVEPLSASARIKAAKSIVTNRSYAAAGAGIVPLPIFDLVAITGVQLDLVRALSKLYDVQFKKNLGKTMVSTLIGSYLPMSATPLVASLFKSIPLIGQTTGAITLSVFAGASTYAVGQVFIQHFESGGTFLDFDPEAVKDYFAAQMAEGEKVVG